ncbi:MAG: DUF4239 domain-containing protein [Paraburkholderia sp.]|uniref:bestrophin-like domain n=1 Tax=Paraburkholderia sp. TaxID=1926495 RepID=UPI00121A3F09|nr:hypothetical protein [Paraburkholderia sp.]TAL97053.1 MAG: DUF4239 domain-containing protein [Paraburkholderia sp.]
MTEVESGLVVFVVLLVATGGGVLVRPLLPEEHKAHETVQLIQLVIGMLVTFAALVLGLMTASAKTSFDTVANDFRAYAADLIQLDVKLRDYGPDASKARTLLRAYTAEAIATTWPEETPPPGDYYQKNFPHDPRNLENRRLGHMLDLAESEIRGLNPSDTAHRVLAAEALDRFTVLSNARWKLIEESHSSISDPFFLTLTFWLSVIFLSFGLIAPRNALALVTITLGALSIASAIYGIVDLDTPFTGPIVVPSQPMRDALAHLLS